MSLIQEALKRQEEEQKKANEDKSISEAISDDVKLTLKPDEPISSPDILAVSTPEDTPAVDSLLDDNVGLDDFILPDDFSMDSLDNAQDTPDTPALLIKDDVEEAPSLLARKEKLEFSSTVEPKKEPLAPPQEGLGSLKLQTTEAPKKLYEDPVEKVPAKKSKKKKKVVSKTTAEPSGTVVHPALNNTDSTEEKSDQKSTSKIILVVIIILILIGAGIYYGLSLIGVDIDTSSITKYIPGKGIINKTSTKSSSDDLSKGTIKVSKVVDNPKSTAGKAIQKANMAVQDIRQAQKQEVAITETLTSSVEKIVVDNSGVNNTSTVNTKTSTSEATSAGPAAKKTAEKSLSDKYQNSRMTERIKAKLAAKRLEEEKRLQTMKENTETTEKNVDWPSATLSGTIGLSKSGAAIFDKSNIVNVGETYKGMKLIDVTKDKKSGVILEYEGQTRFLATGQSL